MSILPEPLQWLYATQHFGVKLGLHSMRRLAEALELSLLSEPSPQAPLLLHVAGTNGKGSTCAMAAALCQAAGLRVALYTSPHLLHFRERIQIQSQPIPEPELLSRLTQLRHLVADWNPHPTFFEITTALALRWFQDQTVDALILETGLGGRLDATNIVTPTVSVLTPIGLDHRHILGNTLPEIATEKAGIFKPGIPIVSAPQAPEVAAVFETIAAQKQCPLSWVDAPWHDSPLGLAGSFQSWNAALALRALHIAGLRLPPARIASALSNVRWPGRFQRIGTNLVLDGAHNPPAARTLVQTWRETFGTQKAVLLFGLLADKDGPEILNELAPILSEIHAVPIQSPRALSLADTTALLKAQLPDVPRHSHPSISEALTATEASPHTRLVTGSLHLIGETLAALQGSPKELSAQ